jgi:hypothetical protein
MKKNIRNNKHWNIILSGFILMMITGFTSCSGDDDIIIDIPSAGDIQDHSMYLFRYNNNVDSHYWSNEITSDLGGELCSGNSAGDWNCVAGISLGIDQYLIVHSRSDQANNTEFKIRKLLPTGYVGDETCSQNWHNSYETLIAYNVGDNGFVFGQDSDSKGHYWFVQQVNADGTLGGETDNGTWSDYYSVATPLSVNNNTYIFFQTKSNGNYWFISHATSDGRLSDVCDGYWGHLWTMSASVTIDGNTYLVGGQNGHENYPGTEYFIQKINSDGTMGNETDRGGWGNDYFTFTGFTNGGKAYLFACACSNSEGGMWFIQEITADGKLGTETAHGTFGGGVMTAFALPYYDKPGSFRYSIGWDMSKTSGKPDHWSQRFDDVWNGGMKMGGGAALGNIDGDSGNHYDAVLMGIQDMAGPDRYYYKVAWNLDETGGTGYWSQTMFGPTIGESEAGGGAELYDIDGNGVLDLLFMNVDDPVGANSFRYQIGWNLNAQGVPTAWGNMIQGPVIGDSDSGGGAAIADLDNNGKPELVFMGIDNPSQANSYWIVIGKNLDKFGVPESWTNQIILPVDLGWESAGGGLALADLNGNGKPDVVIMDVDSPHLANGIWCRTGWDIDINGNVAGWSGGYTAPSTGNVTSGGGTAVADIDKNGSMDVLMMAIDNPFGAD